MKATLRVGLLVALGSLGAWAGAPAGHFTVQVAQGTVKDNKSNLTWERGHSPTVRGWADAATYCTTLNVGGFSSGWRLPMAFELETLVDVRATNPAVDTGAFPDTTIDVPFWTATADAANPTASQWVLYFSYGMLQSESTSGTAYWVRCVR